ncbi:MAG: PQQ-binding-like beta-propeller repeat protein, partial [Gemmatimonadales bacterium]
MTIRSTPSSARRAILSVALISIAPVASARAQRATPPTQQPPSTGEWTAYGHDAGGTKYSPAATITRNNVAKLAPVWTYRSGDYSVGDAMARDETTPLFVDNTLYASTPFGGVRALDPATGRELWSFDSQLDLSGGYGDFTNRGVATWLDPSA